MMGCGPEQGGCDNCDRGPGARKRMGGGEEMGQGDRTRMRDRIEEGDRERTGKRQGRGDEGMTGRRGGQMGPQQGGPGRDGGMRPPVPPFISALDKNGDKIIDADEIASMQKSMKKLDKNGDGKLTMDELLPRPPRMDNEQGGPEGRGQGRDNRGGDRRSPPPEDHRI